MFLSNGRFPCLHSLDRTTWTIKSKARILRIGQQIPWEWLEISYHVRWNWVKLWFQVSCHFHGRWVSLPFSWLYSLKMFWLNDLRDPFQPKILWLLCLTDFGLESPSCELTKPTETTIWSFSPNLQHSLCWVSEVDWWKEWLKDIWANIR